MIKIVLDVYSGDNPTELIKGATEAVNKYEEVHLIMPGDPEFLEGELKKYDYDKSRIEILPASEVITNDESPTMAIRQKKDSTLVKGANILKNSDVDAMISAGSTGAILCSGIFVVGRIRGIDRPALVPILPTATGGYVCLVDCGANADCRARYLAQFALMGTSLMQTICGVENPRVALVNVGEEDHKGNALTEEATELIKSMPVNFVGNMEAREALSGRYDVIVSDGFVGNVLLKSIEGTAKIFADKVIEKAKKYLPKGVDISFMEKAVDEVMEMLDYNTRGGAWLIGCNKPLLKIHGAANYRTISFAVGETIKMIKSDMVGKIKAKLQELT